MTIPFDLPSLPYADWAETKDTLHRFCQIVGKIRMATHPKLNHWWHVTLYPGPRGLTTRAIPYGGRSFELAFDLHDHTINLICMSGKIESVAIAELTVAEFYDVVFAMLARLGYNDITITPVPYDMPDKLPFPEDTRPRTYDKDAVHAYWIALAQIANVFDNYRAGFIGKQTPTHLYWHSFDLAVTRFSGRPAQMEGGTQADREAYSHEVISIGFWPGDPTFPEAAFYAYTYPEPTAIRTMPLGVEGADWADKNGSALAVYRYEDWRKTTDPEASLLAFLNAAYDAGATLALWDKDAFLPAVSDT
ncbi:MAG: DUF5996 family protein [Pseudomonadota bacterium]